MKSAAFRRMKSAAFKRMKSAALARGERGGGFHPPYDHWKQYKAAPKVWDKFPRLHPAVARYRAREG
jgi:hypothetical protein